MPYVLSFAIFMILAGLTLPRSSGLSLFSSISNQLTVHRADYSLKLYFMIWFSLAFATFVYIRAHGVEYVSWPRLKPLDDVIYYDGPGFRSRKGPKHPLHLTTEGAQRGRLTAVRPYRVEEIEMGVKKRTD